MEKHNDGLNYETNYSWRQRAFNDISKGYKENGKTVDAETRNEIEILRDLAEKEGVETLSASQMISLGYEDRKEAERKRKQAEYDAEHEKQLKHEKITDEERQKARDEQRNIFGDPVDGGNNE